MRGWLIVNAFLNTQKFQELYALLNGAAFERGVVLQLKTNDEVLSILQNDDKQKESLPQFVLFWDKDVYLAKRLETLGVRLFNSAAAVELCDDKILTALALQKAALSMPKTYIVPKTFETVGHTVWKFLDDAERELGYPMVIKEAFGSFGAQVYLANTRAEAEERISSLRGKAALLQEFIAASSGRDIRVNVVGNQAICAIERVNAHDFRSNITNGGTGKAITPSKAVAELAIKACRAVGADFAGVDILMDETGAPLVCEVNSNPHFKSTLDVAGVDLSGYIIDYIKANV